MPTDAELSAGRPRYLAHLDGLRALCCLWIVSTHFANPRVHDNKLNGVLERGFVPVDFFIFLSGFTTHYASAHKPLGTAAQIARFHMQRIGRILPLHWACVLTQVILNHWINPLNLVGSLLLLTSWHCYAPFASAENSVFASHQCDFWPYNPLHWTLSTMLLSWLLYPLTRRIVRCGDGSTAARVVTAVALLSVSLAPYWLMRAYLRSARATATLPSNLWSLLYQWPPLRVTDFMAGMGVGQLARDDSVVTWRGWGPLVDASALALLITLLAVPMNGRSGVVEGMLISGLNPIFAIILLGGCSALAVERSALLRAATKPSLAAVGKVSFHMYLMQEILAKLVLFMQNFSYNECTLYTLLECTDFQLFHKGGEIQSEWWLIYLALLVGLANAWYEKVEEPWTGWLRNKLDGILPMTEGAVGGKPGSLL